MSRKVVLIDGNSLVYRAFYALPTTLALKSGQVTNAVYGFTSMLIRLLADERPDIVAVAFDSRGPTWRHDQFEEYKANREKTPDELISQIPLVKDVLSAMAIPIFEMSGHEADDILATLAAKAKSKGDKIFVVTGDKDAFQLITDDAVKVMTTKKGITDIVVYGRDQVKERYGITPEQVPDFLGLKGDSSDNIPGVPGVGDKTAAKLLDRFGSLEEVYRNLDNIPGQKLRANLAKNRDLAELSKKLAVLSTDLPLELDEADCLGKWNKDRVRSVFNHLEFRTLFERFEKNLAQDGENGPFLEVTTKVVGDLSSVFEIGGRAVGLSLIGNESGDVVCLAAAGSAAKARAGIVSEGLKRAELAGLILAKLAGQGAVVCVHNVKDSLAPLRSPGLLDKLSFFDPMLAAYILNPSDQDYSLGRLCRSYLDLNIAATDDIPATAGSRACASLALRDPLLAELEKDALMSVYEEIELPLVAVLARMESTGVGLDKNKLDQFAAEIEEELNGTAERIFALAGEEFNINSPKQVSRILFEKLGLEPISKTKSRSAYATDAAVLSKLAAENEIASLILEYREAAKLKSTYAEALPKLIDPATGRLHTSFNQAVTATGRLSSSNPNLQNIPTRTKAGKRIREAFIPAHPGEKLMTADYSQIELRLLAHFSGDEDLRRAFEEGLDIHSATAAEVFGTGKEKESGEWRRRAKAVNFGIVYGISAYGLSQQLGISAEEAQKYIDLYFSRYPAVKYFIEQTVDDAKQRGYVTTISGRKRYIPELKSPNWNIRSFGERVAINTPLQGSAADIIKIAMIDIDSWLMETGLQSRMVLQVHDELIFEVPPIEEAVMEEEIRRRMTQAVDLEVPMEVKIGFYGNWGEED